METIHDAGSSVQRTGLVHKQKSPGGPPVSEENFERMRQSGVRNPKNSIVCRSLELQIPKATIRKVLRQILESYAYIIHLLQELKPTNNEKRFEFLQF